MQRHGRCLHSVAASRQQLQDPDYFYKFEDRLVRMVQMGLDSILTGAPAGIAKTKVAV